MQAVSGGRGFFGLSAPRYFAPYGYLLRTQEIELLPGWDWTTLRPSILEGSGTYYIHFSMADRVPRCIGIGLTLTRSLPLHFSNTILFSHSDYLNLTQWSHPPLPTIHRKTYSEMDVAFRRAGTPVTEAAELGATPTHFQARFSKDIYTHSFTDGSTSNESQLIPIQLKRSSSARAPKTRQFAALKRRRAHTSMFHPPTSESLMIISGPVHPSRSRESKVSMGSMGSSLQADGSNPHGICFAPNPRITLRPAPLAGYGQWPPCSHDYVVGVLRILRCPYFTSLPLTITVTMLTSSLSHLTSLHLISSHHTSVKTHLTHLFPTLLKHIGLKDCMAKSGHDSPTGLTERNSDSIRPSLASTPYLRVLYSLTGPVTWHHLQGRAWVYRAVIQSIIASFIGLPLSIFGPSNIGLLAPCFPPAYGVQLTLFLWVAPEIRVPYYFIQSGGTHPTPANHSLVHVAVQSREDLYHGPVAVLFLSTAILSQGTWAKSTDTCWPLLGVGLNAHSPHRRTASGTHTSSQSCNFVQLNHIAPPLSALLSISVTQSQSGATLISTADECARSAVPLFNAANERSVFGIRVTVEVLSDIKLQQSVAVYNWHAELDSNDAIHIMDYTSIVKHDRNHGGRKQPKFIGRKEGPLHSSRDFVMSYKSENGIPFNIANNSVTLKGPVPLLYKFGANHRTTEFGLRNPYCFYATCNTNNLLEWVLEAQND
ncbi:uncharacterized protein CLUP02_17165 [Colletotrichum lupini]|uniref:Uncharacterized protein n=1 Tax=Colletotrichum lupini TaxID=145971 RepID=A0A9Q8WQ80_9PEZI|nr:uncharacterized protein CLUP02_17165 [Colletotrichum lupini]UQC91629.1 hypothetical protein CLUP02_17165 [Colletotrichum lupini]